MKRIIIIGCLLLTVTTWSQSRRHRTYGESIAETVMKTWKDSFALDGKPAKWTYDMGVVLKGFEGLWLNTGDAKYYNYIQQQMDFFVKDDGTIKGYKQDEYNIDNVNNGKLLLSLYRVTLKEKYLKAATLLREQLRHHPRTNEGGFWHKKIYPYQMWLDGLYMGEPFYAEYAMISHEDTAFNDIANQFIWIESHVRDPKTGLLYHAWDESKQMKWANPTTGTSPLFWARAMGWYGTALVDVLDYFPVDHPKRKELIAILNRFVNAIEKQQDKTNGLWKDILNYNGPGAEKNYFEASASSQFVYTVAKGVRMGYLPAAKIAIATKGYTGILNTFIKTENGQTNLHGTVKVSGLGGNPFRDGSFEYYMSEPVIVNDAKGVGAFLLASNEMEMQRTSSVGKGKTVVMDNYFNRETHDDAFGKKVVFHYKWWERDNGGFSFMGHIFNKYGVATKSLDEAPTAANLKNASIYLLIDPDWPKENKTPNYIEQQHIDALYNYVKNGGVLVMMANDSNNVEFKNYNKLADRFGIQWNENMRHDVIDNKFEQGAIVMNPYNPIFRTAKTVYIKQLCTQDIKKPAVSIYSEHGEVIMSAAKVGKGIVFAVGDPWFYNEYLDGRKIPAEYENYKAAADLVKWLLNTKHPLVPYTDEPGDGFLDKWKKLFTIPAFLFMVLAAKTQVKIIVGKEGKGDFKTIQDAINSLPDSSATARVIFIKKGTYSEKLFIEKSNIIFEGEDRDKTIITQDIARDEWRCSHPDDWGVATMNVNGNDITLKDLTIANDYGFNVKESMTIDCPSDTVTHKKTITNGGHQMALRTMKATRLKAINCHFRAYAGDTVSPWNTVNGMFYFKDCYMEGGVDFYCPRGWAWAENCEFHANTGPASIWHDGSGNVDSKTVLFNCKFNGYDGFMLGRYHRDAQFYLVNCSFAKNMRDTAIYLVPTTNTIQWGKRIYYYNCHRDGGNDFSWYSDNLPAGLAPKQITVSWVFGNRWSPGNKE